ncbi:hypothetical protein EI94DRAFT_1699695 [Lactarius quietus]|nr:hypothetical protein EI94DRAFT_1699695 [Lactarius quietus]
MYRSMTGKEKLFTRFRERAKPNQAASASLEQFRAKKQSEIRKEKQFSWRESCDRERMYITVYHMFSPNDGNAEEAETVMRKEKQMCVTQSWYITTAISEKKTHTEIQKEKQFTQREKSDRETICAKGEGADNVPHCLKTDNVTYPTHIWNDKLFSQREDSDAEETETVMVVERRDRGWRHVVMIRPHHIVNVELSHACSLIIYIYIHGGHS